MRVIKRLFAVLVSCYLLTILHAAVVLDGTLTNTVIYQTYTFSNGDEARGDVKFKNGFTVPAAAIVTLDITERVDGPITLISPNAGVTTLILNQDLYLGSNASITYGGVGSAGVAIVGNRHKIIFESDLSINRVFPSGVLSFSDVIFSGRKNRLTLSQLPLASLRFGSATPSNPFNGFEDTIFYAASGSIFSVDGSSILLKNVDLVPGAGGMYLEFPMLCQGDVRVLGVPGSIIQHSAVLRLRIDSASQLYFSPGVQFHWVLSATSPSFGSIDFTDKTSKIIFDNATLQPIFGNFPVFPVPINDQNYTWTGGTVIFNGAATIATAQEIGNPSSLVDFALNFGDGNPANDLDVFFLAGSKLVVGDRVLIRHKNVK